MWWCLASRQLTDWRCFLPAGKSWVTSWYPEQEVPARRWDKGSFSLRFPQIIVPSGFEFPPGKSEDYALQKEDFYIRFSFSKEEAVLIIASNAMYGAFAQDVGDRLNSFLLLCKCLSNFTYILSYSLIQWICREIGFSVVLANCLYLWVYLLLAM